MSVCEVSLDRVGLGLVGRLMERAVVGGLVLGLVDGERIVWVGELLLPLGHIAFHMLVVLLESGESQERDDDILIKTSLRGSSFGSTAGYPYGKFPVVQEYLSGSPALSNAP
jgi:hypothetical protein